ncbi:MAG: UDP-2,3-diacylglucosamine diphosphatase LpxI [Pseudomonadota bacterium]
MNKPPIGVVAGGGDLVLELLDILRQTGTPHCVAALKGEVSTEVRGSGIQHFTWGEIGKILTFFKTNGCQDLILIGRVDSRPDFKSIMGDRGTLMRLPKIIGAMSGGGDDSLLRKVLNLIEYEGFRVIGVQDVAADLLAPSGSMTKRSPPKSLKSDIERAKTVLSDLGKHDIGQVLVIHDGRIVAVEGAEGTDNVLRRIGTLRQEGRMTKKASTGILVKASKPQQDLRVDLPTIGPDTIALAADAGLSGIVVEAGRVLIARKSQLTDIANRAGLFVYGENGFGHG